MVMHKTLKKRLNLLGAVAMSLFISESVWAQEMTLKFAGVHPADHYGTQLMQDIKVDIEGADVGLKLQLFPSGQLGSGEELLDDAVRGNIDLVNSFIYPNRDRRLEVISLPFLVSSAEEIDTIYRNDDSAFNQLLSEAFTSLGLEFFKIVPEGFIGVVATKKPDNYATTADKNINIRVWGSQIGKATVEAIGYNATTMNWGEVFAALQSGVVDGAICCTAQTAYTAFAVSDIGKYYIPYNAVVETSAYYASSKTWAKLNDEQKVVVSAAFTKAANKFADWALANETEFTNKLIESGYEVLTLTDEERAAIAEQVKVEVWPLAAELLGEDVMKRLVE